METEREKELPGYCLLKREKHLRHGGALVAHVVEVGIEADVPCVDLLVKQHVRVLKEVFL